MCATDRRSEIGPARKAQGRVMARRTGFAARRSRRCGASGCSVCALISGCQPGTTSPAGPAPKPAAKPAGPSKVTGGVKEADLTKVELTEDAEKRLGISSGRPGCGRTKTDRQWRSAIPAR